MLQENWTDCILHYGTAISYGDQGVACCGLNEKCQVFELLLVMFGEITLMEL